jgi:hypothetical protein
MLSRVDGLSAKDARTTAHSGVPQLDEPAMFEDGKISGVGGDVHLSDYRHGGQPDARTTRAGSPPLGAVLSPLMPGISNRIVLEAYARLKAGRPGSAIPVTISWQIDK